MIYFSNQSKEKRRNYIIFITIVITFFLFLYNYLNKYNSYFQSNFNYIKEFKKIEDYLKFCNNTLIKIKKKKYENPKISIISTIYNRGKY